MAEANPPLPLGGNGSRLPVVEPEIEPTPAPGRRTRTRGRMSKDRREKIANRVVDFYRDDMDARSADRDLRLQRYAKYRQWTSGRDWPWPDASDQAIPDIPTSVNRTEDTLHNAVMSNRPAVVSRAQRKGDEEKQATIDELHDFQLFVEQPGERIVEELADQFVKEGVFTAYTPWVKEERRVDEARIFDPIPEDLEARHYFEQILLRTFPDGKSFIDTDEDSWDWTGEIEPDHEATIRFYTMDDGMVEMVVSHEVEVYNGPRVIVKDYEQVVTPQRVANLQPPSPSNPGGSPHVILWDEPTIDEIQRLRGNFYDLLTKEEADALENETARETDKEKERQKDILAGQQDAKVKTQGAPEQDRLTRLVCFDIFDLDGDGKTEDVIFWVILETKTLLRVRHLTEMYPANPPRRPFAEAQFLPVKGRREGIGLIELMEPLSDWKKVIVDMMVDSGSLANTPFFFYRPSSGLNPETFRPWPGDGIPVNDPNADINFPQFSNQTQAWAINLLTVITNMEERLDLQGDLQLGRVPAGRASALRTIGGIQTILGQGEARPERILRRFFSGLVEIFRQMHALNQRWLPKEKKFRIAGALRPDEDPYRIIESTDRIRGRFKFDFDANVLNASKQALQQSLEFLLSAYVSDITLGLGIVKPEGIYRLMRDLGKAVGQQPDKYLNPPTPDANLPLLNAEEAFTQIAHGQDTFFWRSLETPEVHLQRLLAIVQADEFAAMPESRMPVFREYLQQVASIVQATQAQQKLQRAAGPVGQLPQGVASGSGPQATGANRSQPPIQENELLDETLPSAGGGANPGVPQ